MILVTVFSLVFFFDLSWNRLSQDSVRALSPAVARV